MTWIEPFDLHLTKFMVLETIGALLLIVFFIGLAMHVRRRDVDAPSRHAVELP